MRGAAVLTRTSSLWLVGLGLYVALKSGALLTMVLELQADYAVHDTYYVVASPLYLIATGSIFVIFAAFYLWCERSWGRRYDDRLGKAHVVLALAGVVLIALPQLMLAAQGTPSRYVDFSGTFHTWTMVSTAGFALFLASLIPFALVCLRGYFVRPEAA